MPAPEYRRHFMTDLDLNSAAGFPYEAVMEFVRLCRNDPKIERAAPNSSYRRRLITERAREVGGRYNIEPRRLAHVTALMMQGKDVQAAFA